MIHLNRQWLRSLLLGAVAFSTTQGLPLLAQTSAFTYQGRLTDGANPASGVFDLQFSLYDSGTNGNLVAGPLNNAATSVSNGLFTVTIDFGSTAFNGPARWLELGVRTNGAGVNFQLLAPRQPVTSTPYAIRAASFTGAVLDNQLSSNVPRLNSDQTFSGSVNFSNVTGKFVGNGAGLTNLNATNLSGTLADARLSGNVALLDRAAQSFTGINSFAGPVGVGTTSPDRPLSLVGTGNSSEWISLRTSNGSPKWHINSLNGGLNISQTAVSDNRIFIANNGNVGIGTGTPTGRLSVEGQIRMGAGGNLVAAGSSEPLRMIRGIVSADGQITSGSGFTVTRNGTGSYTITFNSAFPDLPSCLVTPIGNPPAIPGVSFIGGSRADIHFTGTTGIAVEPQWFSILAIGAP